jgi:hypothetical protein
LFVFILLTTVLFVFFLLTTVLFVFFLLTTFGVKTIHAILLL